MMFLVFTLKKDRIFTKYMGFILEKDRTCTMEVM